MKEIKTKEDVFKAICNASRLGNLGFFVGSGFTKAILENNTYYEAYTWAELLKVCCEEMKINENILKNKNYIGIFEYRGKKEKNDIVIEIDPIVSKYMWNKINKN